MRGQAPLAAAQPGRRAGGAGENMTAARRRPAQSGRDRLPVRVIDLYSAKPLDVAALLDAAAAISGRLVVARIIIPRVTSALPSWRR